jgi:hypothetical protein
MTFRSNHISHAGKEYFRKLERLAREFGFIIGGLYTDAGEATQIKFKGPHDFVDGIPFDKDVEKVLLRLKEKYLSHLEKKLSFCKHEMEYYSDLIQKVKSDLGIV